MLERQFKWHGILAEPAKCWHGALRANRNCKIDTRCVWNNTGENLTFSEANDPVLSTVNCLQIEDFNSHFRQDSKEYQVETVSINDLLSTHQAPKEIDFLSVDTEGSEFLILKALDFSRFHPKIITVEHNYTSNREEIRLLLTVMGYVRVFDVFTQWDDWYVKSNLLLDVAERHKRAR